MLFFFAVLYIFLLEKGEIKRCEIKKRTTSLKEYLNWCLSDSVSKNVPKLISLKTRLTNISPTSYLLTSPGLICLLNEYLIWTVLSNNPDTVASFSLYFK